MLWTSQLPIAILSHMKISRSIVCSVTGMSWPSIVKLIKRGDFPAGELVENHPARGLRWRLSEVQAAARLIHREKKQAVYDREKGPGSLHHLLKQGK